MKYEIDVKNFYEREGKLRLIFSVFMLNSKFYLLGGTAEYVNRPETLIEFAYNGKTLYKSREDFPRLLKILNNFLTNNI